MFYSPLSSPLGWFLPDGKGIYTRPASTDAPDGWGEPRWDTSVTPNVPIVPGTPGGPFERVLLKKTSTTYKSSPSRYFQKSGNIYWTGEYRKPGSTAKGRYCLSYAGPKLRYFKEEGFSYGDTPDHNEIYILGQYAAVAPFPVTGACMRKLDYTDRVTGEITQEWYIIASMSTEGRDVFYRKLWKGPISVGNMSDEVREYEMKLYSEEDEIYYGWEPMGSFPKMADAYSPETPWFFNRSGTEAVTVRRTKKTFNNGSASTEEDYYVRLQATVGEKSVTFTTLGNNPPMTYKEIHKKVHPDVYEYTDSQGYPHTWQEDHVFVTIELTGEQYVFGDYKGDTLYWAKMKYDILRKQEHYFTEGLDPQPYPVNPPPRTDISNKTYGRYEGPYIYEADCWSNVDPNYVPSKADHNESRWISIVEDVFLFYGPVGNEEENRIDLHYYRDYTSDEWAGNPYQSTNPYLYAMEFSTRYPQGVFDIRWLGFIAKDYRRYSLNTSYNIYDRVTQDKHRLYSDSDNAGKDLRSDTSSAVITFSVGWSRSTMLSLPAAYDQTLTRTTYIGKWIPGNHYGAEKAPGSKTFYSGDNGGDVVADWPTIQDLLTGSKNDCKGNGVVDEFHTIAYSIEAQGAAEGQFVLLSNVEGVGAFEGLIGYGTTFYPLGVC